MMKTWDVCVIGAGPSGSHTARQLAAGGLQVLLLEEHELVGEPRHCTGILGQEAFDSFPDLPRHVIQADLKAAWLVSPSGERVRTEWFKGKAMVIDRAKFDQSMARLATEAGATLRTGTLATSVKTDATGVTIGVESLKGIKETLRAKAVVIAAGVSYRLHSQVGLEPPTKHLMCAQTEVHCDSIQEVEVYIGKEVAPGSFAWSVPIGEGRLRVGVTASAHAARCLETLLAGPHLKDKIQRNGVPVRKRVVPIRTIKSSVNDRVMLVGDAAGQVKTTTGGGIYYGLLGARAAADVMVKGFAAGRFDRSFYRAYDKEWKRVLRGEAWMGRLGRQIFEHFSDQQLDRLVRVCSDEHVSKIVNQHADFDWHSGSVLSFLTTRQVLSQLF